MPAAEHPIDAALVRGLLDDQHPDLAQHELTRLACGWDNEIFRLGEDLLVRLPRRQLAAGLLLHEQRWLPQLAPCLPLPIPAPLRVGVGGRGYPWAWSVCPWFEGETAAEASLDLPRVARELGAFVAALHMPAPAAAPANEFRGVPLAERGDVLEARVAALGEAVDADSVRACWADATSAPVHAGPAVWLHGDLHPANLLVRDDSLVAVLDFGDVTGGDPATDLAAAWMLFPPDVRPAFRAAVGGVDEATWRRARGWALSHAIACLASSADDPRMDGVGAQTLAWVLDDTPG